MRKFVKLFLFLLIFSCAAHLPEGFDNSDANIADANTSDVKIKTLPDAGVEASLPYGIFDTGYPETDQIVYLGGNVSTSPINVYFIWYGDWSNSTTPNILEDMMGNISNNPWYNIVGLYYQDTKFLKIKGVNNKELQSSTSTIINFMGSSYVAYTYGSNITSGNVEEIVADYIKANSFDDNGLYFVLTSVDVNQSDILTEFCDDYCGWHNSVSINNKTVRLAFIGDVTRCPSSCSVQSEFASYGIMTSPNNDWSADGMSSVILHELSEVATDPYPSIKVAWIDDRGAEIADKCAWTFGQPYYTANSAANVKIGNRDFIIQQNWVLQPDGGGSCELHP